jgi:sugar phosphate isomerase/epimerase
LNSKVGAFVNGYVNFNIEDAVEGISKAGFKYIELLSTPGLAKGLLQDPEEITAMDANKYLELCKSKGIKIFGLYYYKGGSKFFVKEKVIEKFNKLIDIAGLLDLKFIITDTDEVRTSEDEKSFYYYAKVISDYASSKDMRICLDIHGDWCNSGKKAIEIIRKVGHPSLGINYCTGNVIYYGNVRPEEDIKYALPYMFRMHIKDSCGVYKEYNFPALGEGDINFKKIYNLIEDFSGPVSVEVDFANKVRTLKGINEAFKKSYSFLKDMGIPI